MSKTIDLLCSHGYTSLVKLSLAYNIIASENLKYDFRSDLKYRGIFCAKSKQDFF